MAEPEINEVTRSIIGAAIQVHRRLGPGMLESCYRRCLAYELEKRGHRVIQEMDVSIDYDELHIDRAFRADLVVDGRVTVELKSKKEITPTDKQQVYSHIRLLDHRIGLLINFNVTKLTDGIHRVANNYRDSPHQT